jgi:hypothetical protein
MAPDQTGGYHRAMDETYESTLRARKWVALDCDYSTDGVKSYNAEYCCADELPVDAAIIARIRAWQEEYEAFLDMPEDEAKVRGPLYDAEGLAIAQALKAALPDWTVVYDCDETRPPAAHGERYDWRKCEVQLPPAKEA